METIAFWLQLAVATVAIAALLKLVFEPRKRTLHLVWALFCGSLAVMMVKQLAGDAIGPYQYLVGMGACATCNAYWLVSRALFRPGSAFTPWHIGLAASIALLMMVREFLRFLDALGLVGPATLAGAGGGLGELIALLGSGVLLLTFREGLIGWAEAPPDEKRLRLAFLATYSFAVMLGMIGPAVAEAARLGTGAEPAFEAFASLVALLVTSILVHLRSQEATVAPGAVSADNAVNGRAVDTALAASIDQLMRGDRLFLEPELKVADVARRLDVPEYRVSRSVTRDLGQPNFNRYVNGFRIAHARGLLEDPTHDDLSILVIALDSGFASLGPFNRAFKERTGATPTAFRRERPASPQAAVA